MGEGVHLYDTDGKEYLDFCGRYRSIMHWDTTTKNITMR